MLNHVETDVGLVAQWQFHPRREDFLDGEELADLIAAKVLEAIRPLTEEIRVLRNKVNKLDKEK